MHSDLAQFVAMTVWNPPMHFDGTITLGTLISAVAFLVGIAVAYHKATLRIGKYFTQLDGTLGEHSRQLREHSERMGKYETSYNRMANDLQWLIGATGAERRHTPEGPAQ